MGAKGSGKSSAKKPPADFTALPLPFLDAFGVVELERTLALQLVECEVATARGLKLFVKDRGYLLIRLQSLKV